VKKLFASNETRNFTKPYPQPGEFTFSFIIHFRGVHKLAKSDRQRRHVCLSVRPSVCPHGTMRLLREESSWNLIYFSKMCPENSSVIKISGYFTWSPIRIFTILCPILKKRNVSDKRCRHNQQTFYPQYFILNHAVYVIMGKNIVQPGRPQMTTWRTRITCWIPTAKNTQSKYVILTAFLLQQWLHERASMLRYMYTACLVAAPL